MTHRVDEKWAGSAALLLAAVIWGFGYIVIADSLDTIHVSYLMSYRYILAAAGMLLAVGRQMRRSLGVRPLWEGAVLGLLLYLSQLVQTMACGMTSPGNVSFITALYVVLVPIFAAAVFRERAGKATWGAVCLALPGLFLLTRAEYGINGGDLLALAGSMGFAVHMLCSDRYARRDSVVLLAALQFFWAAVFSTAALVLSGRPLLLRGLDAGSDARLLFMGLISTLLGFFLQIWGQKRVPAALTAVLLSTEALFGMLFSILFAQEVLTARTGAGCVLLLAAILLAECGQAFGKTHARS